ncbi:hypothetical protein L208DRAFT_1347044, partial [Tricholoma matsutake]
LWWEAIREAHSDWEVGWTPTVHRTDKRMWVQFPDAKKSNSPVCSSFVNKGGAVLSMASPSHVNSILAMHEVRIPCVDQMLKAQLMNNFVSDGESTLASTQVPSSKPEAFVFHMTTWDATLKVLSPATAELFSQDFSKYKSLVPPQSVYGVNNKGLWRRTSVHKEFVKGSVSMNKALQAIN